MTFGGFGVFLIEQIQKGLREGQEEGSWQVSGEVWGRGAEGGNYSIGRAVTLDSPVQCQSAESKSLIFDRCRSLIMLLSVPACMLRTQLRWT